MSSVIWNQMTRGWGQKKGNTSELAMQGHVQEKTMSMEMQGRENEKSQDLPRDKLAIFRWTWETPAAPQSIHSYHKAQP